MKKILFVCLGNICRSPTAHGVVLTKIKQQGLEHAIVVDSAGTGDWHIGRAPDKRAQAAALQRGYDLSALRARQVGAIDFDQFDYVLAMDKANLTDLQALAPVDFSGELKLFLSFGATDTAEVPDPYFGGEEGFTEVLNLIEDAADGLLAHLKAHD